MTKATTGWSKATYDKAYNPKYDRTITSELLVSPDGDNSDGETWATAFQTFQAAFAVASTDANDCTLIRFAPHATFYDIYTTGDPTYTGNYEIVGTHRIWAPIRNTHASATSVFKFTGKVSIQDMAIFTVADEGGVIFTNSGWRIRKCGFNSTGIDTAQTSVYIDGTGGTTRGGIMEDVQFIGHVGRTKAIHINQSTVNEFYKVAISKCLTGLHIDNAASDNNIFSQMLIGDSATGIDIDAGNDQFFNDIVFHHNTVANVADAVGDHVWVSPKGQFPIAIEPDNTDGVNVACDGVADTWGGDTEIRATATSTKPFRIVGTHCEPNAGRIYQVRFSSDSGSTFYDQLQFSDSRRESVAAPSGTEYIFNAGTRISASARDENGGGDVNIWIEVQEI